MHPRQAELQDRYRAAVVGFAIGDALGFPFRGLPPAAFAAMPALGEEFVARPRGGFPRGQFSDDTQMLLAVAGAVAGEGRIDGRAVARHLSSLWLEGTILHPQPGTSQAVERLLAGTPWMSAGAGLGVQDPGCLSRGVVLGLWGEPSPPQLAHQAQVLSVMTHKDPLCAAGVAAVGRAVQLALSGEPLTAEGFCEQVAAAAGACHQGLADELACLPRALAWEPERAVPQLRQVGVPPGSFDFQHGLPPHVTPVLLTAFYAVLKAPHFPAAMALVLRAGGEVDVAAGVAGAVLGALLGTEALPARLRKAVAWPEALSDAADRVFELRVLKATAPAPAWATVRR